MIVLRVAADRFAICLLLPLPFCVALSMTTFTTAQLP